MSTADTATIVHSLNLALDNFANHYMPFIHIVGKQRRRVTALWEDSIVCPQHGTGKCMPKPGAAINCDQGCLRIDNHVSKALHAALATMRILQLYSHKIHTEFHVYTHAFTAIRYDMYTKHAMQIIRFVDIVAWAEREIEDPKLHQCPLQVVYTAAQALRGERMAAAENQGQTTDALLGQLNTLAKTALAVVEHIAFAGIEAGYSNLHEMLHTTAHDCQRKEISKRYVPIKHIIAAAAAAGKCHSYAWNAIGQCAQKEQREHTENIHERLLAIAMGASAHSGFERLGRDSGFYDLPVPTLVAIGVLATAESDKDTQQQSDPILSTLVRSGICDPIQQPRATSDRVAVLLRQGVRHRRIGSPKFPKAYREFVKQKMYRTRLFSDLDDDLDGDLDDYDGAARKEKHNAQQRKRRLEKRG